MIAATRIHRGPYRALRRLARKLLKPLRLAVIRHQIAASAENIAHYEAVRYEALLLIASENRRQVKLAMQRNAIEVSS